MDGCHSFLTEGYQKEIQQSIHPNSKSSTMNLRAEMFFGSGEAHYFHEKITPASGKAPFSFSTVNPSFVTIENMLSDRNLK